MIYYEHFCARLAARPSFLSARPAPAGSFPRLSAFGYWCFLIGGIFVCGSLFFINAVRQVPPRGAWIDTPITFTQDDQPKLQNLKDELSIIETKKEELIKKNYNNFQSKTEYNKGLESVFYFSVDVILSDSE